MRKKKPITNTYSNKDKTNIEKKYSFSSLDNPIKANLNFINNTSHTKDFSNNSVRFSSNYLNELESSVYSNNFSYIDLNSFYRYFIMQEFCGDIDIVFSSFHCTKRRNDIKLYFGPVWDYDLSFDNDKRLIPTNEKPKFVFNYGDSAGTMRDFLIHILNCKNIIYNINQTWTELQQEGLNFEILNNFIEEKKELLIESANLNNLKWYNTKIGEGKKDYLTFVDVVVDYIRLRFGSLSKLINDYNYLYENIPEKNSENTYSKIKFPSFLYLLIAFLFIISIEYF